MEKIFLNNELIWSNTLTKDGVLTYMALRALIDKSIPLYNRTSSVDCISANRLSYSLLEDIDCESAFTNALVRGIDELSKSGWISIHKNLSNNKSNEYVLDLKNILLDAKEGNFTVIYLSDVHKLMTCDMKMDKKIRMLAYYVVLISTFDWASNEKIGHMSQEYIAQKAGISTRTCQRYNDILEEMKIIYIYKSNDKVRVDDKLKQIKNCYSRYKDRGMCRHYAANFEAMYGVGHQIVKTRKSKEQADNNRRLAQLYNRICCGYADEYDEETIQKVYDYVSNKNRALREEIDEIYSQSHNMGKFKLPNKDKTLIDKLKSQIRDVTIFGQFPFLTNCPLSVASPEDFD